MRQRRLGILVATLLAATPALPEPPPEAEPAPVRDYGAGFQAFHDLGLPKIDAAARYVKLQAYGRNIQTHRAIPQLYDLQIVGTAWFIEERPDDVHRFMLFNGQTVDVVDQQILNKRRMERMREKSENGSVFPEELDVVGGTWQDADAEQDLETIMSYLETKAAEIQTHRHFPAEGYGGLFVAMASFYGAGHPDAANRVVQALFDMGKDPRRIIAAGMDQLANTQYEAAFGEFQRDRDWDGFAGSLNELLDRFTTGWRMAPVVHRLSERVAQRRTQPPPIPGLTEDEISMANALLDAGRRTTVPRGQHPRIWILADDPEPAAAGKADAPAVHPIDRILHQRMAAVPFLMALLEDETLTSLTQADLQAWGGVTHYQGMQGRSGDRLTEDQITEWYRRMNRPLERGEIARRLLDPLWILPGDDSTRRQRLQSMDATDFAVEMDAWYRQHKGLDRTELARRYLAEGDSSQASSVLPLLTESDDPEDRTVIENYFISALATEGQHRYPGMGQMHQIQNYVFKHGSGAEAFVERYIAAWETLHADPPADKDDGRAAFQQPEPMRKQMEKQFEQLRTLVRLESPDVLIAKISSGEVEANEVMPLLQRFLHQKSTAETLDLLLPALQKTEDTTTANALFTMSAHWASARAMQRMYGQEPSEITEQPEPEQHAGLWRALLEDKTTRIGALTRASRSAQLMEVVYGNAAWQQSPRPVLWGDRLEILMMDRALARLDGSATGDLPDYPDATTVDDEARSVLRERLRTTDDLDELRAVLAALSPAEELAVSEMLVADAGLNRHLQSVSIMVASCAVDVGEEAFATRLAAFKGRQWNRALVNELHQWGRELAEAGQAIQWTLDKKAGVSGLTLRAEPLSDLKRHNHPLNGQVESDALPPALRGELRTAGTYVQADFPLDGNGDPALRSAVADDDEIDLLDLMERELDTAMDRRQTERRSAYWQAVDTHPESTWLADQAFQATLESHPRR